MNEIDIVNDTACHVTQMSPAEVEAQERYYDLIATPAGLVPAPVLAKKVGWEAVKAIPVSRFTRDAHFFKCVLHDYEGFYACAACDPCSGCETFPACKGCADDPRTPVRSRRELREHPEYLAGYKYIRAEGPRFVTLLAVPLTDAEVYAPLPPLREFWEITDNEARRRVECFMANFPQYTAEERHKIAAGYWLGHNTSHHTTAAAFAAKPIYEVVQSLDTAIRVIEGSRAPGPEDRLGALKYIRAALEHDL